MTLGVDFNQLFQSIATLPQTQKDINAIASAAQQAQDPMVQKQIQAGVVQVETYAKTSLVLQALSTAALVGVFLLQIKAMKKG